MAIPNRQSVTGLIIWGSDMSKKAIVKMCIDLAMTVALPVLMYSSIVISKHVFTFVNIGGAMTARTLHMLCAYLGLVLMSVHLGMHISQMVARMKLKNKAAIWSIRIIFV